MKAENYNKILLAAYLPHFVIGPLFAWLVPDNILDHRWALWYTNFIEDILPTVTIVGKCTEVPAVRFIAAVLGIATIFFWIFFVWMALRFYLQQALQNVDAVLKSKKESVKLCLFFLLVVFFIWYAFVDEPSSTSCDNGARFVFMISSKFAMGSYGTILYSSSWGLVFGLLLSIYVIYKYVKQRTTNR